MFAILNLAINFHHNYIQWRVKQLWFILTMNLVYFQRDQERRGVAPVGSPEGRASLSGSMEKWTGTKPSMTALRQKSTRRNPLSLSHEVCSHSLSEHKPIYCWCLNYCERHVFSKNQMPCLNTIHAVMILVKSYLRVFLIKSFASLTCPSYFIM